MEILDPFAEAERFLALYQRWNGAIPLDDLLPYFAWYKRLGVEERGAFRARAILLVLRARNARDRRKASDIHRTMSWWFPRD